MYASKLSSQIKGVSIQARKFKDYLARKGTNHKLTRHNTHTPEQNGGTEQLNQTLVKRLRAMLIKSNLPKSLWRYAILHANYIKNCMHTHSLPDKTPDKMVHGKKPNLQDAYEWGKDIYVKIKQYDKSAHQATKAKWIGHSSPSNGHLIYWPSRQKVSVERNVIFNTREKVKLSPNYLLHHHLKILKVSMSKKPTIVPPIVLSVPSTPVCISLSQPSGKGRIEEIIEPGPEQFCWI